MPFSFAITASLYEPILFATSPFAATRSAPKSTTSTLPSRISMPAALSAIRVIGMSSCISSQAVSRAPCSRGRVSSTQTCTCLPCSMRRADDAQRGAVIDRRQRAGVAVGQDVRALRDDLRAERAHAPVDLDVLVRDALRLGQDGRANVVEVAQDETAARSPGCASSPSSG